MKMKQLTLFVPIILIMIIACVDEGDLKKNQNPIVGEWVYDTIEYDIKINNQEIYSYLDSLGLPPEDIALISFLIESEISSELEGVSVNFKADNSYELINEEDEIESSGSYELNPNQDKVTLNIEDNEKIIILEILSLNENSLIFELSEYIESPDEISFLDAELEVEATIYFFK